MKNRDVSFATLLILWATLMLLVTAVTASILTDDTRHNDLASHSASRESNRARKARIVKKLKKDFRKLKKQEGALKLVGSDKGDYEGNVEILHNGKWGSICDDEWDFLEATVVCRQLGFEGAVKATGNGRFGQARRRFWMDNIYCDGTEDRLAKCRFDGWGTSDCESSEAAGVICIHEERLKKTPVAKKKPPKTRIKDIHQRDMAIRLAGGRVPSEGRVEIKLGKNDWGVVCGDGWSLFEAGVVCRQLGLGYASDAIQTNFFGGERMRMAISGIKCQGNEPSMAECFHDKILDCPGQIRS